MEEYKIAEIKQFYDFLEGRMTKEESGDFERKLESDVRLKSHFKEIRQIWKATAENPEDGLESWKRLEAKLGTGRTKSRSIGQWIGYAASFAVLLALAYWAIPNNSGSAALSDNEGETVDPFEDLRWVTLVRAGEKFVLWGDTVLESGAVMVKGGVLYELAGENEPVQPCEVLVPKGQLFEVRLSDGSTVTLNSQTRLKYDSKFTEGERDVELAEGEAFFEIEKVEDMPFVVKADEVGIKVLGTKFNVSNYKDDKNISATLVSGKVALYAGSGKRLGMSPSDHAVYSKKGKELSVSKLENTDEYLAWMDSKLVARDMELSEVLKRLGRMHGKRVRFNGKQELSEKKTWITLDKEYGMDRSMNILSKLFKMEYLIEGDTVVVW
ncbi:hypothetical protein FUAX_25620 [Fulvitalea axinellae]|uniref:FecR family protein n=1 Tax=Fulvitalea axinellae TaxID=1182444 RepID=A0AAU9CLF3_9BACT|nr:hypothetical protein FUAX_25620 [Fulvitalea axinellae]